MPAVIASVIRYLSILRHPLFLLCLFLFGLNQLLEHAQIYVWPLHTYLDDLLCLPITLTIVLAAEKAYFRNQCFSLPLRYTLMALILFAVVFEGFLPLLSSRYTADILDIVAYTLGAIIFHFLINKPSAKAPRV